MSIFRYRDKDTAEKIVDRLRAMNLHIQLMHVCGTHQDTITRYGLDYLLEKCGVRVRQGPGCPVCVTTAREFAEAEALARAGKTITTFGDASKVPGVRGSLMDLRGEGCDVRVVYGIGDGVKLAQRLGNDVVFFAVGFETTAPATAEMTLEGLPENFSILSCHRYMPPALNAILSMGELRLDGIIEPGHVSTIIGVNPYEPLSEAHGIPQVVAGFEPLDVLMSVYMLARQIKRGEARVENEYQRVVRYSGNLKALKVLDTVFEAMDLEWRGFPEIPDSGMMIKSEFQDWDARRLWEDDLEDLGPLTEDKGCRCGEVLRGVIESWECPLFGETCTPVHPIGPCMVSVEGSCNIEYKYKKEHPTEAH